MKLPAAHYRIENLQRAWRWLRSNPDAGYKTYFREHYAAYTTAQDALLKDLSDRLRRGAYVPAQSCKIYLPKASGILRPYSLLDVEDQIVYQAAANVVAERLFPRVRHRYFTQVFGHRGVQATLASSCRRDRCAWAGLTVAPPIDELLAHLFDLKLAVVCTAIREMHASLANPPKTGRELLDDLLKAGLPETVSLLKTTENLL